MGVADRQSMWKSRFDDSLAIVNNGTGYIETDFMLGDQMTLEVCFKKTSTTRTGALFVGKGGTGGNDDLIDFRFFFAPNPNYMYCDCGCGVPSGDSGGRYYIADETTQWHVVEYPKLVNGTPVALLDGNIMTQARAYKTDGNWGTVAGKLSLFGPNQSVATYQPGAIRYVNVWQYNTDNLLASFWPDKAGGIKDIISRKTYLPLKGSVEIVKWKDLGVNMNEG